MFRRLTSPCAALAVLMGCAPANMKTPDVPEAAPESPEPPTESPEPQSVPSSIASENAHPPENTSEDQTTSSGRLPPEVIQKQVRANSGAIRRCYENGLRSDPKLTGRVAVRFVIGVDGKVTSVTTSGDMPDEAVESCVADAARSITFPSPEGGIVTVSYPFIFTPDAK